MALIQCDECGKEISETASSCPHCGAPRNHQAKDMMNYVVNPKLALGGGLLFALLLIWFYLSPYIALYNLKDAVEKKDYETVASYIDFGSVKESIKSQLNAEMSKKMGEEDKDNPFTAFAVAVVGTMVDTVVTPENLTLMLSGKPPIIQKSDIKQSETSDAAKNVDFTYGYKSFDVFVVDSKSNDRTFSFTFNRIGLFAWKLVAVKFSDTEQSHSSSSVQTPKETDNKVSKKNELPFIGKKDFNFTYGNGTGKSISIDSNGHTEVTAYGASDAMNDFKPTIVTLYSGQFSNPLTLDDGSGLLFKEGMVFMLNSDGEIETGCTDDGTDECESSLY